MRLAIDSVTIFWLQVLVSCAVCALVAKWYVWPRLTELSLNSALIPLIFVHVFFATWEWSCWLRAWLIRSCLERRCPLPPMVIS